MIAEKTYEIRIGSAFHINNSAARVRTLWVYDGEMHEVPGLNIYSTESGYLLHHSGKNDFYGSMKEIMAVLPLIVSILMPQFRDGALAVHAGGSHPCASELNHKTSLESERLDTLGFNVEAIAESVDALQNLGEQ